MSDSIWHLHNTESQQSLNGIPFKEVVSILKGDTEENRIHWLAWTAGWSQWKNVTEIPEIMDALTERSNPVIAVDFSEGTSVKAEPVEKRQSPRYEVRFRVVIVVGSHTFRTHTKNISTHGLLLEDPIPPDMFQAVCQVFIGSPELKENIAFTGVQVGDPSSPCRFRFQERKEAQTKLNAWIQALVKKHGLKAS